MKFNMAKTILPALCFALVAQVCSAANYPVGTFVIYGVAKDAKNRVLGTGADDTSMRLQAVATNGTVLAESEFVAPTSPTELNNFLLQVPLTLSATERSAAVGDTVRVCLVEGGVPTAVASDPIRLYSSSGYTNLALQLYATVSYTNKSGQVATLPRDYVQGFAAHYAGQDVFAAYDPFADDDGDGRSNYAEYLAATDPFDKTDSLRVRAFERTPERVKLTFEYVGGVVYGVSASPSLDPKTSDWQPAGLATDSQTTPSATRVLPGNNTTDFGTTVLYMLPTEKADSMFYKLEVK